VQGPTPSFRLRAPAALPAPGREQHTTSPARPPRLFAFPGVPRTVSSPSNDPPPPPPPPRVKALLLGQLEWYSQVAPAGLDLVDAEGPPPPPSPRPPERVPPGRARALRAVTLPDPSSSRFSASSRR